MHYATPSAVLEAYIAGLRELDVQRVASCFHHEAVMSGNLNGQLMTGTPRPFFADIARMAISGVDNRAMNAQIRELNVQAGGVAAGLVFSQGFAGLTFEDRFHLIRQDAGWCIISKLFTTL